MNTEVIVKTETGRYKGFVDKNRVSNFLGIRYAKTPQRWKKAEPLDASNDIINADEFGAICYQPLYEEEHEKQTPMSEDCLTLNIWTADLKKKNKPVMIWIHGGCFISGSNRVKYYCNDSVASECKDIIFININYRIGCFGSMDLSVFDKDGEYKDAPNLQIFDQMAAIKWVYENISAFGGNPDNITVYGQSAGSYSTATLLLIPQANQYISKAICQSSGYEKTQKTVSDSMAMGEEFIKLSGAKCIEELLELTAEEILEISLKIFENPRFPRAFGPVRDGRLIPKEPYKALKNGVAKHVTLMAGTVSGEYDTSTYGMPDEVVKERIMESFGERISENTIQEYISNYGDRSLREAYMDLRNDMMIRMPVLTILESQCMAGADTYMYYIDYTPEGSDLRAQHMFEIPFINDKLDVPVHMDIDIDEPVQGKQPDRNLASQLQSCWIAFARTGSPRGEAIDIEWPEYTLEAKSTMVINNTGWNVEESVRKKDIELLQKLMFK